MSNRDDLLRYVRDLAAVAPDTKTLMQRIADHVHSVMPRYNSISFRLIDKADPGMLILLTREASLRNPASRLGRVFAERRRPRRRP